MDQILADRCFLDAVGMFCTDEAVVLARYILLEYAPGLGSERIFSEVDLMRVTGWTEYMLRRVLGRWKTLFMCKIRSIASVTRVKSSITFCNSGYRYGCVGRRFVFKGVRVALRVHRSAAVNKTERCLQEWSVNTVEFTHNQQHVFALMRQFVFEDCHDVLQCCCDGSSGHFSAIPNENCTTLVCFRCGEELKDKKQYRSSLWQLPLYESMSLALGWRPVPSSFVLLPFKPIIPKGVCSTASASVCGMDSEDEDIWEDVYDKRQHGAD